MSTSKNRKILIVGGYGKVGLSIAKYLAHATKYQISLGGRNPEKGLTQIHHAGLKEKVTSIKFNANASHEEFLQALKPFDTLISCVDIDHTDLVLACIQLGINYIDVTANNSYHQNVEELLSQHKTHSTILLSVGLAPGLTNLLAANLANSTEIDTVDISILLGSGEKHGSAAIHWTIRELLNSAVQSRCSIEKKAYGNGLGTHYAFPFNFSDQYSLERTLKDISFKTRLSMDHSVLELLTFILYRFSYLAKILKSVKISWIAKILMAFKSDSEAFSILIESYKKNKPLNSAHTARLNGFGEGNITGLVAALACIKVQEKKRAGIFHFHEFIDLNEIQPELTKAGCMLEFT